MSSAFDQLTEGLSPEEKRELLEKIQNSLNWSQKDSEAVSPFVPPREEIYKNLAKDAEKMSFFRKLVYRILSFFMGLQFEELLLRSKIHELKKKVDETSHGLIYWDRRQLSEVFGRSLWDLYRACWPLQAVFQQLGKKSQIIEKTVTDLLEAIIPQPKTSVFDLVTLAEMGDIYRSSGQKEKIHKRVKDAIGPYLNQIPEEVYHRVRDFVAPIYHLKPLVTYPYHVILQAFGVNVGDSEPGDDPPPLHPAYLKGLVTDVEKLYYALYLANKIQFNEATWRPLFQNYVNISGDKLREVDEYLHITKKVLEEAASIFGEIPWKELIQSLNENPYYSLRFYLPQFDVKGFYKVALIVRFSQQVEDIFPELRRSILEREKNTLFQNQNSQLLLYYNTETNSEIRAMGGEGFRFVDSLNLINTFLVTHYSQQILPLFQTLSRVVLQTFKGLNNELLDILSSLEELKSHIGQFDKSLSPEQNDGVTLLRLKQEAKSRILSLKSLNDLVTKKDKEAWSLIHRALELLRRAQRCLEEIANHTSEKMKSQLKLPYIMGGVRKPIREALEEKLAILVNLLKLVEDLFSEEEQRS